MENNSLVQSQRGAIPLPEDNGLAQEIFTQEIHPFFHTGVKGARDETGTPSLE